MKFYNMRDNGLKFAVYCGNKIVIPKGAKNVKIAFKQSHLRRFDKVSGQYVPMNVYIYNGKIYHA